jgi:hypothetical protein
MGEFSTGLVSGECGGISSPRGACRYLSNRLYGDIALVTTKVKTSGVFQNP